MFHVGDRVLYDGQGWVIVELHGGMAVIRRHTAVRRDDYDVVTIVQTHQLEEEF